MHLDVMQNTVSSKSNCAQHFGMRCAQGVCLVSLVEASARSAGTLSSTFLSARCPACSPLTLLQVAPMATFTPHTASFETATTFARVTDLSLAADSNDISCCRWILYTPQLIQLLLSSEMGHLLHCRFLRPSPSSPSTMAMHLRQRTARALLWTQ